MSDDAATPQDDVADDAVTALHRARAEFEMRITAALDRGFVLWVDHHMVAAFSDAADAVEFIRTALHGAPGEPPADIKKGNGRSRLWG